MHAFVHTTLPGRVVFGVGTLDRLEEELDRLGIRRVMVLATRQRAADADGMARRLGARAAGTFAGAVMHTPVEVTERALDAVTQNGTDGLLAIGGGSTIGLAKAIALRTDLPQLVVPTTYAGSEMTPILGETRDGVKTTQRSLRVLPETVIYDAALTLSLPPLLSGTSGINAIAHGAEALYAQDRSPLTSLMAEDAVRRLARALPAVLNAPANLDARGEALQGAWLAGACLGAVGMALHHKLCHLLGGAFDLPHAETHTAVLPHAIAYNAGAAPEAMHALSRALDTADPARALYDLAGRVGAERSLRALGMPQDGIDCVADLALTAPYWNPRPLERNAIRRLLAAAWAGEPP